MHYHIWTVFKCLYIVKISKIAKYKHNVHSISPFCILVVCEISIIAVC